MVSKISKLFMQKDTMWMCHRSQIQQSRCLCADQISTWLSLTQHGISGGHDLITSGQDGKWSVIHSTDLLAAPFMNLFETITTLLKTYQSFLCHHPCRRCSGWTPVGLTDRRLRCCSDFPGLPWPRLRSQTLRKQNWKRENTIRMVAN